MLLQQQVPCLDIANVSTLSKRSLSAKKERWSRFCEDVAKYVGVAKSEISLISFLALLLPPLGAAKRKRILLACCQKKDGGTYRYRSPSWGMCRGSTDIFDIGTTSPHPPWGGHYRYVPSKRAGSTDINGRGEISGRGEILISLEGFGLTIPLRGIVRPKPLF